MNNNDLVLAIHNEIDSAEDRLLQRAKEILSNPMVQKDIEIENYASRLKKVGFINSPIIKTADNIRRNKEVLVKTKEMADLILYYRDNYPFLKFLTEDEFNRICEKYKLIYAPVGSYIKEVPEKNLREIETCQKLKPVDNPLTVISFNFDFMSYVPKDVRKWLREYTTTDGDSLFSDEYFREVCPIKYKGEWLYGTDGLKTIYTYKTGLFIAAPKDHFNTRGLIKKGLGFFNFETKETKDPIVFRYVKGGLQVITKWGLEANDPSLVIPKLN